MKSLRNSNHYDFIKSPISKILLDAVSVCNGIGNGMEVFPISDYVVQSVFIKMTGFQEQKIKCIYWELATVDYEFRYDFTKKPLGECSSYNDKNEIYSKLIKQIKKYNESFNLHSNTKSTILDNTTKELTSIFENTNLLVWGRKKYYQFIETWSTIDANHFAVNDNLFHLNNVKNKEFPLKKIYENHLHKNRNRIAHNTLSYQQNLPTLKILESDEYKYENHFIWFSILILIDKLLIELYNQYITVIEREI